MNIDFKSDWRRHVESVPPGWVIGTIQDGERTAVMVLLFDGSLVSVSNSGQEHLPKSAYQEFVRAVRKYLRLTQVQLAEKLGQATGGHGGARAVQSWEGGQRIPRMGALVSMARMIEAEVYDD